MIAQSNNTTALCVAEGKIIDFKRIGYDGNETVYALLFRSYDGELEAIEGRKSQLDRWTYARVALQQFTEYFDLRDALGESFGVEADIELF